MLKKVINLFAITLIIYISILRAFEEESFYINSSFFNLIQTCFLADDANTYSNFTFLLLFFSLLFFCILVITQDMYQTSNKYRSLVFCRYKNRMNYLNDIKIKSLKKSIFIVIYIFFSYYLIYSVIIGKFSNTAPNDFFYLISIAISCILFFNILIRLNIFLIYILNDVMTLFVLLFLAFLTIFIDIGISQINIITYGEESMHLGMGISILILFFLEYILNLKFKTYDLV